MQTVSVSIANYCVPCHARCRYCLLCARGRAEGVEYDRSVAFYSRIRRELSTAHPDLPCHFYIGYCMDTPLLKEYIRFCRETGSPSGKFLQMNGFGFRTPAEMEHLMRQIRACGVELIDLTFYGLREYHDRFAGRKGDYDLLLSMLRAANEVGLPVHISAPLIRENKDQAEGLLSALQPMRPQRISFFLPHSKGRGRTLMDQRLTKLEFEGLSDSVRAHFSTVPLHTEREWLEIGLSERGEKRALTAVLRPEEMDRLEEMDGPGLVSFLEKMDDDFLSRMPSAAALAAQYGDRTNEQLFRERDLVLKWQQQFMAREQPDLWDMRDETHHFSVLF